MVHESVRLAGKVVLEIHSPDRMLLARVEAGNTVMDGGRQMLARLLSGNAFNPVFYMAAGISDKETSTEFKELIDMNELKPKQLDRPKSHSGQVLLSGSFEEADRDRIITEAGLLLEVKDAAGQVETTLYNRVLVKPAAKVNKGDILTLTWTLSFALGA